MNSGFPSTWAGEWKVQAASTLPSQDGLWQLRSCLSVSVSCLSVCYLCLSVYLLCLFLSLSGSSLSLPVCLSVCLSSIHYRSIIYHLPTVCVSVSCLSSVCFYHLFLICVPVDRLSHCLSRVREGRGSSPLETIEEQVSSAIPVAQHHLYHLETWQQKQARYLA